MRYIVNANNYITAISFGCYIECQDDGCTEYTGSVPTGYTSLEDWYADEAEKLYRWKIVNGQLTLDSSAAPPPQSGPYMDGYTLNMNGNRITGLPSRPMGDTDAAPIGLVNSYQRTELQTRGWYRIGLLTTTDLHTAAARVTFGGRYNYSNPEITVLHAQSSYNTANLTYISGCNPYANWSVISAVRMVAASYTGNYIDIYFNMDNVNTVSVEVQTMHGVFEKIAFIPVGEETASAYLTLPQYNTIVEKIWENASKGSGFPAQTMGVPGLSNYSHIIVTASVSSYPEGSLMSSGLIDNVRGASGYVSTFGPDFWLHARQFTIYGDSIVWSGGYMRDPGSGTIYADWAERSIPTAIYGLRSVY